MKFTMPIKNFRELPLRFRNEYSLWTLLAGCLSIRVRCARWNTIFQSASFIVRPIFEFITVVSRQVDACGSVIVCT